MEMALGWQHKHAVKQTDTDTHTDTHVLAFSENSASQLWGLHYHCSHRVDLRFSAMEQAR